MISRYGYSEMQALWKPEHKFTLWLKIEILICEAWAKLGIIPPAAVRAIKRKAKFSPERIAAIEKETRHDVVAFIQNLSENVGEAGKYLHYGVTSYDVVDTALSLILKDAADLILTDLDNLAATLKIMASMHKYTLMAGRSHGMHAEPVTLGLKFLVWHSEVDRQKQRMLQAQKDIMVGKVSGAVGTYATVDPEVEAYVCKNLGLQPAAVSTQILQRDRHANYLTTIALIGGTIEKIATEIRHLQRTEIGEVLEAFALKQTGSSAMPHKRNPITSEQLCGLSRVLRGNAWAAMENVPLWHERDISHSSVERIILPDSTILCDYMLKKLTHLIENLDIKPERMLKNLEATGGLLFSQRLLLHLVEKGMSRQEAYQKVQQKCKFIWEHQGNLKDLISKDPELKPYLKAKDLNAIFNYAFFTAHIPEIFERFGI